MKKIDNKKSTMKLSYLGRFDDEITDKLIGISEHCLEYIDELGKLKGKVSFLIAECFQNIVRYGHTLANFDTAENHKDFFEVNISNDRVTLASCNIVNNGLVCDLIKKLEQVNTLNSEELKKMYVNILNSKGFFDKGGSGLRLIEMARKSGLPIQFNFRKFNEKNSQFFLLLEIVNNKNNAEIKFNVSDTELDYDSLLKENSTLIYSGDLSHHIVLPLIQMQGRNFASKQNLSSTDKRKGIILIEALQNVSKHAKIVDNGRYGILKITKNQNSLSINTSNYIPKERGMALKRVLDSILSMDMKQLSNLYKKRLLEQLTTSERNCGLGLLEIAKQSNNRFSYQIQAYNNDDDIYSINITI